jgi:hypothetical protein
MTHSPSVRSFALSINACVTLKPTLMSTPTWLVPLKSHSPTQHDQHLTRTTHSLWKKHLPSQMKSVGYPILGTMTRPSWDLILCPSPTTLSVYTAMISPIPQHNALTASHASYHLITPTLVTIARLTHIATSWIPCLTPSLKLTGT